MRRYLTSVVGLLLLVATAAEAQTSGGVAGFCGYARVATPRAATLATGASYASLSVTNTPSSPTIPTTNNGLPIAGAIGYVEGNAVRVMTNGTDPTILAGAQFGPGAPGGSVFISCGSDLRALELVAASQSAGNGVVHFFFYVPGG